MHEAPEFWENAFKQNHEMWGQGPAASAIIAAGYFSEHGAKSVFIPGIGYGRNAKVFTDLGMKVTGIEISATAIDIAHNYFGDAVRIYHGPVSGMPFDRECYDGVFCHALIHLLDQAERKKLIGDCYSQLSPGGAMFFSVISKAASTYGQGKPAGKDRFEQFGGVYMFFYDENSIRKEFDLVGLTEILPVIENYPFHLIKCHKPG